MKRIIKETTFFSINYKANDLSIIKLFNHIKKAEEKYFQIFKIKPLKFIIKIVYSRKEFNKLVGFKTSNFTDGYIKKHYLIMFSPSIRNRYTKTKSNYGYDSFFDHEINHFFYITLVGDYNPVWLSEGYASYMMKKNMQLPLPKKQLKKIKNPENFLFYRYIKKKYFKYAYEFYSISLILVKYLIENFGHEKFLILIRRFARKPSKIFLEREFNKIYFMSIKEAVRKAVYSP